MNKEKEIEELAEVVTEGQIHLPDNYGMTYSRPLAKWIIDAGYRKEEEVKREMAKEFKETMKYIFRFILKNKGNTSIPYFEAEERVFYKIDREVDREFLQLYGIKVDE